jgi:ubiquinone/menaquinone biosynthesis C-methylase UbiE
LNKDKIKNLVSLDFSYASAYDVKRCHEEYSRGIDYYRKRLNAIRFKGFYNVLDAGCGYGQWSIALSEMNDYISAIDLDRASIEIANNAFNLFSKTNIKLYFGDIHHLPFPSETFDAVFCYGVLMFTREDLSIMELSRVLKKGGKLYICSDGPAWPVYKMLNLGFNRMNLRAVYNAFRILGDTFYSKFIKKSYTNLRTYISKSDVEQLFHNNDMKVEYYGPDGTLGNKGLGKFKSPFGITVFGLPVDFEILGTKHG